MGFSFIHTADWQIGKPFGAMPAETAVLLRAARLESIDRIAAIAAAENVRHMLVAGDVFDHARPPQRTVGQLLARLEAHRDLVWHLLPGNHDPALPGSVWDDVVASKPANVRAYLTPEPAEIEPGVVLLPAPLSARAMSADPTAFMDQVQTASGVIRIGIAHGSVRGFNSEGEPVIPIDIERARKARLDYLALGDWHGLQKIDTRVWYSGTHEPDGYKDNAPGHCLVVALREPGALPEVRAVSTGYYRWRREPLIVSTSTDIDSYEARLAADTPRARLVVKLDLTGRVPLADYGIVVDRLQALANGLAHLDADTSAIETTTDAEALAALGSGSIATIAQRLAGLRASAEACEQQTAARALRTLARLAGQNA